MRLLFTDNTFILNGAALPDIPFLIDRDCELVNEANDYLLYVAVVRGGTRSPKTWRNHGEALFDFFSWLEANNRRWDDTPKSLATGQRITPLALYRNWSASLLAEGTGQRQLKNSTINQRLTCLLGFYRWAQSRGLIDEVPWDVQTRRVPEAQPSFLRHAVGARFTQQDDVRLKVFKEPPKLLSLEQCRLLVSCCTSATLRLMTILMLQAGLRNEECRTFPRRYVFDPAGLPPEKRIRIELSPNDMALKNSKPRTVFITWHLMRALYDYSQFGEAVVRHNIHRKLVGKYAPELFLNKFGMPYSEKALNNAYRQLWAAPQGRNVLSFRVTPHMLRHTFATLELYHQSQRMPLAQALGWVRDRLGHTSLQTTSIYLHCLDLMDDADLNLYQHQLDQMMQREKN